MTSNLHRLSSFEAGICVCSVEKAKYLTGKGVFPTGAACVLQGEEVSFEPFDREADELVREVLIRGPIGFSDFSFVCDAVEEKSPKEAVALVLGWADGSVSLPPPEKAPPPDALGIDRAP